ncbi:hypothetical protein [Alteromonas macleodii]|uniref:hypothetical protein n=1 Tax=Alteromonas macleodii TaxID=28108 RepID=UPI0031406770
MSEILGLDSAVDTAKENRMNNMVISAELVIEMATEIEHLKVKLQNQCSRMGAVLAENNRLQDEVNSLKQRLA